MLDMWGYVKAMDDLNGAKICKLADKTVLMSFHHINIHYNCALTYMLSSVGEENDGENVELTLRWVLMMRLMIWRKALWNKMRMNLGSTQLCIFS